MKAIAQGPNKSLLIQSVKKTEELGNLIMSANPNDKRVLQSIAQAKSILLMELGQLELSKEDETPVAAAPVERIGASNSKSKTKKV